MWSYDPTKRTEFTLGLRRTRVALGGPENNLSKFLLKSLGLGTRL